VATCLVRHDLAQIAGQLLRGGRRVLAGVGDAETAAQIEFGQLGAGRVGELREQLHGAPGGNFEAAGVEDLRADVRVDTQQRGVRVVVTAHHRHHRLVVGDGEAELLVLVGGGDVFVGMRLHPGGDAHHHASMPVVGLAEFDDPVQLVQRIDDDPPDSRVQSRRQLVDTLVVAVHADPGRIEPGLQGGRQLTCRTDVERQAFLIDPVGHGAGQERLAGVVDRPALEGVAELSRAMPEVLLVHEIDRAAELLNGVGDSQPGGADDAVLGTFSGLAPQCGVELIGVAGTLQPLRAWSRNICMDGTSDVHVSHDALFSQTWPTGAKPSSTMRVPNRCREPARSFPPGGRPVLT